MTQNPMPKVLQEWRELASNPPKVCYNCEWYRSDSCEKFNAVPPKEFAETAGACKDWIESIPF